VQSSYVCVYFSIHVNLFAGTASDLEHINLPAKLLDYFLRSKKYYYWIKATSINPTHLETITLCSTDDTRSTSGTHVANHYTFPRSVPLLSLSLPLSCRNTACSPLAEVWPPPVAPASAFPVQFEGPIFLNHLFLWYYCMSVVLMPVLLLLILLMFMYLAYVCLNRDIIAHAKWGGPRI